VSRPEPSPFFERQAAHLREACRRGPLLDLACGRGRHALAAARLGIRVLALDRDRAALAALASTARAEALPVAPLRADVERPPRLPLAAGRLGAVLVFRFLCRELAPELASCLAPGGLLVYETFTIHQREVAYGPRNPAFLLRPGELPRLFPGLEVLELEEGWTAGARPEALARLVAQRPLSR
jgi:SAM-dependent methyltransferase